MRALLVLLAVIMTTGCDSPDPSDGDGDVDADIDGDADSDGDSDADADAGEDTVLVELLVVESDRGDAPGDPLEGVHVAVDANGERIEVESDSDGIASFEVPESTATLSVTVAGDGYLPVVSYFEATLEDFETWASESSHGVHTVALGPAEVPAAAFATLTIHASGVPMSHMWCVSPTWGAELCLTGNSIDFPVQTSSEPVTITGFVIDPDGAFIDFAETTLTEITGPASVDLTFTGTPPRTPVSFDMTLELPDDPDSELRDGGIHRWGSFPIMVMDAGTRTVRGGASLEELSADGTTMDITVTYMPPEGGAAAGWTFVIYDADGESMVGENDANSLRFFADSPASGSYSFFDVPRPLSPATNADLTSHFEATAVPDAERHTLRLMATNAGGSSRAVWLVHSDHGTTVDIPALPSGYPGISEWDGARTMGAYRWTATSDRLNAEGWYPAPLSVDLQFSSSRRMPLDFD